MQRNSARFIFAAAILAALSGCTLITSQMKTVKDDTYPGQPAKLLVVERIGNNKFVPAFTRDFADFMHQCHVTAEFAPNAAPAIVAQQIKSFGPDAILETKIVSYDEVQKPGEPPEVLTPNLLFTLIDTHTHKNVWKAEIKLLVIFSMPDKQGKALATDAVAQMIQDGMFHSCPDIKPLTETVPKF